jgi:uncharacterized protein YyaL (SSP411 family)
MIPRDTNDALRPSAGPANRLINEKSPYLLQHAHNPVDWYPWGSEAFDKARAEDRPVFLSIGYSTCHWCHVMERESFEDAEVAALLNESFVCIKVDREERPDIDGVYMGAAAAMMGRGGWPLTIIMTPDGKPFYAGTYIPKERRFGMPGMLEVLPRVAELWRDGRAELLHAADAVATALSREPDASGEELNAEDLAVAESQLAAAFDPERGGFGDPPKFPTPHNLLFLLRRWHRTGDAATLAMVEKTLDAMRRGGIYDHLGYGFHRYSTDAEWHLPHFEKMLYDQAMLAIVYTEAFLATGRSEYERTGREILTYVLRDMTSAEGGFYSAEDADSEGVEGKFYLWTMAEIRDVLGPEDAELLAETFGVLDGGNVRDDSGDLPSGANVLDLAAGGAERARREQLPGAELIRRLESARELLFKARESRVRPQRDDKILTDWNGLMVAALATAARAFGEPEYAAAAARSVGFILERMRDGEGRLLHRYREGDAAIRAHADDYAFLIWGLVELYEATFDVGYLRHALALNDELVAHFWDGETGGFYFSGGDDEVLIARRKEVHDGAVPSANSVAMQNLLRLSRLTGNAQLEGLAADIGSAFALAVRRYPAGHTHLLCAIDFALGPTFEVAIVGEEGAKETRGMLEALGTRFAPHAVVILRPTSGPSAISEIAPWTEELEALDGRATAYVCRDHVCELPTNDLEAMLERLTARPDGS